MEDILYFLHVLTASIVVGSSLFVGLVLLPTLRKTMEEAARLGFLRRLAARSRTLIWSAIAILLATGFLRLRHVGNFIWGVPYGRMLKTKIALALIFVLLAALHDFFLGAKVTHMLPSHPDFRKLRRRTVIFAQIQILVLLVVVYLSTHLRLYEW